MELVAGSPILQSRGSKNSGSLLVELRRVDEKYQNCLSRWAAGLQGRSSSARERTGDSHRAAVRPRSGRLQLSDAGHCSRRSCCSFDLSVGYLLMFFLDFVVLVGWWIGDGRRGGRRKVSRGEGSAEEVGWKNRRVSIIFPDCPPARLPQNPTNPLTGPAGISHCLVCLPSCSHRTRTATTADCVSRTST